MKQNEPNIILATILSAIVIIGWGWFYEKPKAEQKAKIIAMQKEQKALIEAKSPNNNQLNDNTNNINIDNNNLQTAIDSDSASKPRSEIIAQSNQNRIKISNQYIQGSINLIGAKFDDLTLTKHFQNIDKKQPVNLFSPAQTNEKYLVDFGWIGNANQIDLPDTNSLWQANSKDLSPNSPLELSWTNNQNIKFIISLTIDDQYLITIKQKIINNSDKDINISNYGRITRYLSKIEKANYILHEGPIGEINHIIKDITYEKLLKEKNLSFDLNDQGWIGITDKYWLSSIIADKSLNYEVSFKANKVNNNNKNSANFNSEFISDNINIKTNSEFSLTHHLFAGAKNVKILDEYNQKLGLKYFDRAVDFGWFYFLTKPFFFIIDFFSKIFGNFGLAILAMTVLIKLALFPMANKSYLAIAKMKKIQPKIEELKKRCSDNKIEMNRQLMELYKKEKVNPAAGCLPVLIQIPVFFALYKVLFVTIDMRHAAFYGWIYDLSAPDSTSIFNLFGLLPFQPFFNLGIWPIIMGITMIVQQKFNPPSSDPIQAKVFKFMPYILTIILANFPAGLVIYWSWSNILSIIQQYFITRNTK